MTPERKTRINNHLVEEYYWNGKMVVYLDHKKVASDYETTINYVKQYFTQEVGR